MAHGTVQLDTFNIFINAPKLTLNRQLTVEGDYLINVNNELRVHNEVSFNNYANFYYDVYFSTPDGYIAKAKLKTQKNSYGYQAYMYLYSREQYDTFEICTEPVQSLHITFYGGNHIVQFKVMTQSELNIHRLQ